jgi:hypothetical protein
MGVKSLTFVLFFRHVVQALRVRDRLGIVDDPVALDREL